MVFKKRFQPNVELDANLVIAALSGGIESVLAVALACGCPTVKEAMARPEWLKHQPQEYINQVAERVAEIAP
jgi:hypothetical protein